MKKKEKNTIASMSLEDLTKEISLLKAKRTTMRLERYTKQQRNTREQRQIARKIAILQTFKRQKELTV